MARRKKPDDLEIPKFLRRRLDKNLVDRILRQDTQREWVMPDRTHALTDKVVDLYDDESTQETDMAKKKAAPKKATKANGSDMEVQCSDPNLPVEVNFHQDDGKTEVKSFPNMTEFLSWFSPSQHVLDGSIADDSVTMVEITEKERPKADKKTGKKGQDNSPGGAIPQPEKAGTSRGALIKKAGPKGEAPTKKPRGVGFVRHGVRVAPLDAKGKPGKPSDHSSLYQAFVALNLSIPAHTKFRAELKKSKGGTLDYEEKGKKYKFDLVELKK